MNEVKRTRKGTNQLPFAKILKSVMEERNLTVRAVAEMAGVNGSVIQSWLTSANPHDLKAVAKLAQALGMNFKGLLLGEEETVNAATTIGELFTEQEWFDGICKVSIKRLVPRNNPSSKS